MAISGMTNPYRRGEFNMVVHLGHDRTKDPRERCSNDGWGSRMPPRHHPDSRSWESEGCVVDRDVDAGVLGCGMSAKGALPSYRAVEAMG